MRTRRFGIEQLETRRVMTAVPASLLGDFTPGPESSEFTFLRPTETHLYIGIDEGQLWRTDGTTAGTNQLIDLPTPVRWGNTYSLPDDAALFQVTRYDATHNHRRELWYTDGSLAGTQHLFTDVIVREVIPVDSTWSVLMLQRGSELQLWRIDTQQPEPQLLFTVPQGNWLSELEFLVHSNSVLVSRQTYHQNQPGWLLRLNRSSTEMLSERTTSRPVMTSDGVLYGGTDEMGTPWLFQLPDPLSDPVPLRQVPGSIRNFALVNERVLLFYERLITTDPSSNTQQIRLQPAVLVAPDNVVVDLPRPTVPKPLSIAIMPATDDRPELAVYGRGVISRSDGTVGGTWIVGTGVIRGQIGPWLYLGDSPFVWGGSLHHYTDGTSTYDVWTGEPAPFRRANAATETPVESGDASVEVVDGDTVLPQPVAGPAPSWRLGDGFFEYYSQSSSNPNSFHRSTYYAPNEQGVLVEFDSGRGHTPRMMHRTGKDFYLSVADRVSTGVRRLVEESRRIQPEYQHQLRRYWWPTTEQGLYFSFGQDTNSRLWRLSDDHIVESIEPFWQRNNKPEPIQLQLPAEGLAQFVRWKDHTVVVASTPETGAELWAIDLTAQDSLPQLASVEVSELAPALRLEVANPQPGVQYDWDLNQDGVYDDAHGATLSLAWDQVDALQPPIPRNVFTPYRVRATAADRSVAEQASLMHIGNPAPRILSVQMPVGSVVDESIELTIKATDHDPITYHVDFGDGTIIQQTTPVFSHTYTETGIYQIKITVRDPHGLPSSKTKEITVRDPRPERTGPFRIGTAFGGKRDSADAAFWNREGWGPPDRLRMVGPSNGHRESDVGWSRQVSARPPLSGVPSHAIEKVRLSPFSPEVFLLATDNGLSDGESRAELIPTGVTSRDIAVADFNGDDRQDIYVANDTSATGQPAADSVLLHGGQEVERREPLRQLTSLVPVGANRSWSVETADLNGDGTIDAVTAGPDGAWLHFNDGQATFATSKFVSGSVNHVAVGDLDGDLDIDLVVALNGPNRVYLNDGTGGFVASGQMMGRADSAHAALGDLDGDGDLDAMFANAAGQGSTLWWNDGNGQLTDSETRLAPRLDTRRILLVNFIRSVHDDGRTEVPDVVLANFGGPDYLYRSRQTIAGGWTADAQFTFQEAQLHTVTVQSARPMTTAHIRLSLHGANGLHRTIERDQPTWNETRTRATWDVSSEAFRHGQYTLWATAHDEQGNKTSRLKSTARRLPGDVDRDWQVTEADLQLLAENFGRAVDPFQNGDDNGDGIVDFQDFLIWSNAFASE